MMCSKLSIFLLMVCVTQCTSMSSDELEDFRDFLQRTSQLDQNVKTAGPEDDVDEPVSDHAWEESGKFEGDLILNEKQRRLIVENVAEGLSRNGLKDSTKRWPNNEVIYYIQREHFSADQVDAIQSGINDLAQASCIKFRPYQKGDRDAVVIQGARRGCFSQVGYQGGYQVLNLSQRHPVGRGCFRHGTVVHELLHSLGFYHMQSSPDRDDYVEVIWENIREPARHNFRKYNTFSVSDFGVGYDYDSVLHYSRRAFSSNGGDTLVPKSSGAQIGQRVGLSQKDTEKLNRMYCDAGSDDEEETTKRTKKKKPKNLPFQGHGIGYHQGKAVVIQLPDAKTYKLPDVPSYTVFNYFSKIPETLPPAIVKRLGIGKKIVLDHNSPSFLTVSQKKYETPSLNKVHQDTILTENKKENEPSNNNKYDEHYYIEAPYVVSSASYDQSDSLNEEVDRLGGILKTHVYPSQTPDLSAYKTNTDYKEFYMPNNIQLDSEPELRKLVKLHQSSLPYSKPTEENFIISNIEATKQSNITNSKQFDKAVVSNDENEKTVDEILSTMLALKPHEDFWSDDEPVALYDTFFTNNKQNNSFSTSHLPKAIESKVGDYKLFEIDQPFKEYWYPIELNENRDDKSEYISSPLTNGYWDKLIKFEQDSAESSAEHIEIKTDKNKTFESKKEPEVIQPNIIKSNSLEIKEFTNSPLNSDMATGLNVSHNNEQVVLSTLNETKDEESNKHDNLNEALLKGDEIKQHNITEDYEVKSENDYDDYNNHRQYLLGRLAKIKNGYVDFEDNVPKPISEETSTSFEQNDFE